MNKIVLLFSLAASFASSSFASASTIAFRPILDEFRLSSGFGCGTARSRLCVRERDVRTRAISLHDGETASVALSRFVLADEGDLARAETDNLRLNASVRLSGLGLRFPLSGRGFAVPGPFGDPDVDLTLHFPTIVEPLLDGRTLMFNFLDVVFTDTAQIRSLIANITLNAMPGVPPVSAVALPAALPMFGTTLLALGALGYGMKRKKVADAV